MIVHKVKSLFTWRKFFLFLLIAFIVFSIWYIFFNKPSNNGNWQQKTAVLATAEFKDNLLTIRNVRNFKYPNTEDDPIVGYYDKTYDLNKVSKTWFVSEPFKLGGIAAHTFLSFEFSNGDFLSITIESRLKVGQKYSLYKGFLHTYPLIYIPTDEKDAIYMRTIIRKSIVDLYPVRATAEQSRILLTDMLNEMNKLTKNPDWYHTIWANCTSRIAYHVNKIWPDALSTISWQLWATGHADELAFKNGLIDSDLSVTDARQKYLITEKSQKIGYAENYSKLIRE